MALGFRFTPGQSSFLLKDFQLPEPFAFRSNSLGLFYAPISAESMFPYNR